MAANRIRRLLAAGAVMVAAGLATALPTSAATHRPRHPAHHRSQQAGISIPQHNGGDRDADSNGGPSDGDGNV
jgi:hypothetical protein